jgi:hypothetical protein
MKILFPLLAVVALLCGVAPLMASPIPISAPLGPAYAMGSNAGLGFSDLDVLSSSYRQGLGDFNVPEAMGNPIPATGLAGPIISDRHSDPGPTAIRTPVSEPSGLMVMMGSGLFGAGAFLRRRLKA